MIALARILRFFYWPRVLPRRFASSLRAQTVRLRLTTRAEAVAARRVTRGQDIVKGRDQAGVVLRRSDADADEATRLKAGEIVTGAHRAALLRQARAEFRGTQGRGGELAQDEVGI